MERRGLGCLTLDKTNCIAQKRQPDHLEIAGLQYFGIQWPRQSAIPINIMILQFIYESFDFKSWILLGFGLLLLVDFIKYWNPSNFPPGPRPLPFLGNVFTEIQDFRNINKVGEKLIMCLFACHLKTFFKSDCFLVNVSYKPLQKKTLMKHAWIVSYLRKCEIEKLVIFCKGTYRHYILM